MFRPPAVFKLLLGGMMAYKDSRRQLLQSSSESSYTSLYLRHSQIHRLIPQNLEQREESKAKDEPINWHHMTSSAFL